jgi:tyrosyl-tRNA synthetase
MLDKENIIEIIKIHNFNPNKRIVQKFIAKELITSIHSKEDYEISRFTSEVLFKFKEMSTLEKFNDVDIIKIFKFIPKIKIDKNEYLKIKNVIDLVYNYVGNLIFSSKKEVKRSINENSLIINKIKINDINQISDFILLKDKYLLIQKGKKNFYIIVIV